MRRVECRRCDVVAVEEVVVRPDGMLLCYQPYGEKGLLIADIDIAEATGLLAARCKSMYLPAWPVK